MKKTLLAAVAAIAVVAVATPSSAQETVQETYSEIESAFGFVPAFFKVYPEHGVAAAWRLTRDLELKEETALSPKVKSLINIAVGAQIPCQYCIFANTEAARAAGASEEEIKEAVAQTALTRHWSTILNGLQVDLDAFKAEFGGEPVEEGKASPIDLRPQQVPETPVHIRAAFR